MRRRRPTFDEIQAAKKADALARCAARDRTIADILREHAAAEPLPLAQLARLTGLPAAPLRQRLEQMEAQSGPGPLGLASDRWVWVD